MFKPLGMAIAELLMGISFLGDIRYLGWYNTRSICQFFRWVCSELVGSSYMVLNDLNFGIWTKFDHEILRQNTCCASKQLQKWHPLPHCYDIQEYWKGN
jgi:hypothetical protein